MSAPIIGDVVLAMSFTVADGGEVGPAVVLRVHDGNVLDVMCGGFNPGTAQAAWIARLGLTEVFAVADVNGGVAEAPGIAFVPGTWCRRERCG